MAEAYMRDLDGEDADEAQMWMRDFTKYVTMMTLSVAASRLGEVKATAFSAHIAQGSEAEVWYNSLTAAQKDSWTNLVIQFNIKWPVRPPIAKTIKDYIDEFHSCVLAADEMLARYPTGINNNTQWGYVIFADKLRRIGNKTTLPLAALLIDVKEQMPHVLVRMMQPHAAATTWSNWCAALMALDAEDIRLEQAQTGELAARLEKLELALAQSAQPAQQQQRPVWTPRANTTPQYQATYTQYGQTMPIAQPTPLQAARLAPPATVQAPRLTVNPPPPASPNPFYTQPPPATPENAARVAQERREWAQRWPDARPYATRGYPLTPGTAPAATGCSRCGEPETPGHDNLTCTNAPLDSLEQRFRGNVRTQVRKAQARPQSATVPRSSSGFQFQGSPLGPSRGLPALGRGAWSAPSTPAPVQHVQMEPADLQHFDFEPEVDYSLEGEDDEALNGPEVL